MIDRELARQQRRQLELAIQGGYGRPPATPLGNRRQRARWWFQQMHSVVDAAFDWREAASPSASGPPPFLDPVRS